jgi:predicted O-linked N-acetylglucosamine transferase (SPINDLY family)
MVLHQQGRLNEAAAGYRKVIAKNPSSYDALHYLGTIEASFGRLAEARALIERSLGPGPANVSFLENYATIVFQLADYRRALEICDSGLTFDRSNATFSYVRALSLYKLGRLQDGLAQFDALLSAQPNHIAAHNERGSVLAEMKRYEAALAAVDRALSFDSRYAEGHLNRGNICNALDRHGEALTAYERALSLNPRLADAWLGRGNALRNLRRYDEALQAYDQALQVRPGFATAWLGRGNVAYDRKQYDDALAAYDRALSFSPGLAEAWIARGHVFYERRQHDDAFAAYDKALSFDPGRAGAWLGRGNLFKDLKQYDDALGAYDKALSLDADLAEAWLGRGNTFHALMQHERAAAAYDKALSLDPKLAEAWFGRGNLFSELKQPDKAFAAYDEAVRLKPGLKYAEGSRLTAKLYLCDWTNLAADISHLVSEVKAGKLVCNPFSFLAISSSPADQLQCAKTFVADQPSFSALWRGENYSHDRIRVAYLSADFHEHATAHLMAGLFEHHDKSRFEVTALSFGPDQDCGMRRRLKAAFEHFIDVHDKSDHDIGELVRQREIDIAVDLKGFTQDARFNVLARRVAPIQVSYIGYPGSMGAGYIDYIIADRTVILAQDFPSYSERVVWLPDSYQVNDAARHTALAMPTRRDCGLPDSSFVFCCFNNAYKITPGVFAIWMRLLHANANNVLWLLDSHPTTAENLRRAAAQHGVSPGRLTFAPRMPLADHLARHRNADLFLDTLPYNAHTTASDALWAEVPVLTCAGTAFPGRVAASLLKAIGLDELITNSLDEYEALATKLAREPQVLSSLKKRLADNKQTQPLFDTARFARHLEAAYTMMWLRRKKGEAPQAFAVSQAD